MCPGVVGHAGHNAPHRNEHGVHETPRPVGGRRCRELAGDDIHCFLYHLVTDIGRTGLEACLDQLLRGPTFLGRGFVEQIDG